MASLKEEVSLDLDMLGIAAGGILYRAADRWRVLPPSQPGMYLAINDEGWPEWRLNIPEPYTESGWLDLPLINGAAPFSGTAPQPIYRRTAYGLLTITGFMNASATGNSQPFAVLPEGFRPNVRTDIILQVSGGFGRLTIFPDGDLVLPSGNLSQVLLHANFPLGGATP